MTEAKAPAASIRAARKLPESRFRLADQVRNTWNIVPEEGTPFEALKDPAYWSHNARKMRPGDLIEVVPDEETYWAMLRVMSVGPAGVQVAVIHHDKPEIANIPAALSETYKVEWKGPHHRYAVIRVETKESVQTGFQTQQDAARWMTENARSLTVPKAA